VRKSLEKKLGGQTTASPKFMLKMLGVAVGLTFGTLVHAVGLGGINVVSALGQPLKAEIELVAVSKADKPSLVARLASPDAYRGAGLDYPHGVKYSFQIENRANGDAYLKLSSNQEVNDPFVSLLVELSWSSGKLMREYTFLLDPPGYVATQPKPAEVQAVAPAVLPAVVATPLEQEEAPPVAEAPVEAAPVAKPVERPAQKQAVVAAPVKVEKARPAQVSSGAITVKRGDTLNKIAAQIKSDDVSLERMLVALYRANANQFDGKNMNRIRTGKILRQPDEDALMNVTQSEALQEIRAQASDWNAYRQKLAGAASVSAESETPRQAVSGKVTSAAADNTPVASESAKEVLRLSKGEKPGDKIASGAAGRATSTQEKQDTAAEEAIAGSKALSEEQSRAALLESNLKDMQHLAELKSEAAALAESASQVAAVSEVVATSAVKAAPVVAEEPSLMDTLTSSPLYLGIGAAALLALGGLGIALGRRKREAEEWVEPPVELGEETIGTITGHLTEPVVPSPDTGDFTVGEGTAEMAQAAEEVDPIAEADLFLNFGRTEQAEQVLKDALLRTPDNHQIHLKLLGIYADRQDVENFLVIENQLQRSGDEDAIRQAAVLGQKLGLGDQSGIEDADSATSLHPQPHFATQEFATMEAAESDDNVPEEAAEEAQVVQEEVLDFDLTSTQPMVSLSEQVDFDVTATSPSMPVPDMLDFDIASDEPAQLEAAHSPEANADQEAANIEPLEEEGLPNLDDLIFDVTSADTVDDQPSEETDAESEDAAAEDDGMEFMLDFPLDEVKEQSAAHAPEINLSDISLDLGDVNEPSVESAQAVASAAAPIDPAELWQEVATKIDLARAYQEMGDEVGAREILDEVMHDGDETQKQQAQLIINQLG